MVSSYSRISATIPAHRIADSKPPHSRPTKKRAGTPGLWPPAALPVVMPLIGLACAAADAGLLAGRGGVLSRLVGVGDAVDGARARLVGDEGRSAAIIGRALDREEPEKVALAVHPLWVRRARAPCNDQAA